ncbi:MAG: chemotaxis protein CheW [Nitrospinota bacterium]|nr:chemotaxis protein CheW [Nitrospinota bacterium]
MAEKDHGALDRMLVRIAHLDRLLNLVGEVIITSNSIATTNRRIQEYYDRGAPLDKMSLDMVKVVEEASSRISGDLHSLVMDIRMVEIKGTFQRFRRPVRDMSKDAGKNVELITFGEETLVDKTISEKLYDPINHQVRNSIDHGIEDPLERQKIGKPAAAKLTLKAYQRENFIFLEINDDGRGMDSTVIRKTAVDRGLISKEDSQKLSEEEILMFIYHPGFSTKTIASEISGRGVGMDVVKSNIEELGGEVMISTIVGEGTTFTYKIPQVTAVNILDCLTVRAGKNLYAIPILNVVSTLLVDLSKANLAFDKAKTITYLGSIVTLFDLNELLGYTPLDDSAEITVVIVESKNGRIALSVSELLTPEKLVYTPLEKIFQVQGISGVTMMGGNKMGLIIDVTELVSRSRGVATGEAVDERDSLIRKVLKSTESAEPEAPIILPTRDITPEEAEQETGQVLSSDIGREIAHRDEFLMELEEMINNAGENVLSLERNPKDNELINKVFRDFHSIKGNLMMVGLTEMGTFIHDVESIMDRAREGALSLDSQIVDILLDATDSLKNARDSLVKNEAPVIPQELLQSVAKYKKPLEKKATEFVDVHQRTFRLGPLAQFNLLARRHSGQFVYQVYLSFRPQYQQPFLVALLILRRMTRLGHIFGSVPSIEEIENQNIGSQIKVMFSSNLDEDKARAWIEKNLVDSYDVTEYEILKTY